MKLTIDIDTVELNQQETLIIQIGGLDSWTSLIVRGDGEVSIMEQGKELVSVNMKELARHIGYTR